jgi:hypothetical protein
MTLTLCSPSAEQSVLGEMHVFLRLGQPTSENERTQPFDVYI